MTTSPTGSVEPIRKRLAEISSSYSGYVMPQNKDLWIKMFEEIDRSMASEVRKARIDELNRVKDNSNEEYLGENWFEDENIKDNSAYEVPLSYIPGRIAELEREVK